MMEFLQTCLSFPVNIFTGLLIIAALYWLVASMGLLDIDTLDLDIDPGGGADIGGDIDMGDVGDTGNVGMGEALPGMAGSAHSMGLLPSILFQLGLYGVPMTLILTFIFLVGWFVSYYGFHWGLGVVLEPGLLRYGLGLLLMGFALVVGAIVTSVIIRPLRPLFKKEEQVTGASLRGKTVVVRSTQVSATYGEAVYEDGAGGMLLDVRPANEGQSFKRGDKAVILDFDAERRLYTIISEDEFRGR